MNGSEKSLIQSGMNPERCIDCPPDRICALACEQGWSEPDILIYKLSGGGKVILDEADEFVYQAILQSYS